MIAFDTKRKHEFTLKHYEALPEERRPVFITRALTCRQTIEMYEALEKAEKAERLPDQLRLANDAALMALVGWRNLVTASGEAVEFGAAGPNGLLEVLTVRELLELGYAALFASRLAEDDRKNSGSRSVSEPAASAPTASGGDA